MWLELIGITKQLVRVFFFSFSFFGMHVTWVAASGPYEAFEMVVKKAKDTATSLGSYVELFI